MKKNYLILAVLGCALILPSIKLDAQNDHRVQSSNKSITGMTAGGGTHGYGVAYQYDGKTGKDTVTINLNAKGNPYGEPYGAVVQASNGLYYGMTNTGGDFNYGVIYYYNPVTGRDSAVFSFNGTGNGSNPYGALIQASNGLLYGMACNGGAFNGGVFFSFNPATGKDSVLINFSGTNGGLPYGTMFQASNGLIYGMTMAGGASGKGVIFYYNIATGKDSVVYNFTGASGASPFGGLMQASNGLLYGMTELGGSSNGGVLFSFNTSTHAENVLVNFTGANGMNPYGGLIQAANGLLYGMTQSGGTSQGVLFSYKISTNTETVLKNLVSATGCSPGGTLYQLNNGLIYGLTGLGGTSNQGVIFSYDTGSSVYTVLYNFNSNAGTYPLDGVMKGSDGNFYATASTAGLFNGGTLFRFNPSTHQYTVVYNFGTGTNANVNCISLASNGYMYGITHIGGTFNFGQIFRYNPNTGKDSVVFNFNDTTGGGPDGPLIEASNGLLYGTASDGGLYGSGVLFSLNKSTYQYKVLVNFNDSNGSAPGGKLFEAKNGLLYGTTWVGGKYGWGAMYQYNIAKAKDSLLYSFNVSDGEYLYLSSITEDTTGLLYGTTFWGGGYNYGVLFRYNPVTGKDTTIVDFDGISGAGPTGILCMDTTHHLLYGVTNGGGAYGRGVIYKYNTRTHIYQVMHSFNVTDGATPSGMLLLDTAAQVLYGTTTLGGVNNKGVLFRYDLTAAKDTTLISFSGVNGSTPVGLELAYSSLLSVRELAAQQQGGVFVYPNPAKNSTMVAFNDDGKHIIELYAADGRKVCTVNCTGKLYLLSTKDLAAGMYLMKVSDAKGFVSALKLMVK